MVGNQEHHPRVVGLDALRGLAALAVFVCHLGAYWELSELPAKLPQLLDVGAHGVDVFIVMSGFVLGLAAFRAGASLRMDNFLARRAWRLAPPYLVALALATALAMSPIARWFVPEPARWSDVAWHLLFAQTWNPDRLGSINGSLWSVALEAQLYLVFPLVVLAVRRWGVLPVVLATATLSVVMSTVPADGALWDALTDEHNLPIRLVQFVLGVGCAHLYVSRRTPSSRVLWLVVVLGGLVALGWSTAAFEPGRVLAWSLPCAALILLVAGPAGQGLASTPLERWGLGSYSFYIVHQPVILLMSPLVRDHIASDALALFAGLVVALPATAGTAWLLYVLVERPSHQYGRRTFPLTATANSTATRPAA
ncbi:acyltransferase [Janibacter sp. YB324]|uniref:acyltransferase family protein n=1 Tax=Janibacter sp. YB324 TaxID=2761047 RepID=UPI0016291C0D|nr:acyltransferase [Janibacter sp. YB324]QNF93451.1 acyltransferase [Janibacter sp. YB324]